MNIINFIIKIIDFIEIYYFVKFELYFIQFIFELLKHFVNFQR